MDRGGDIRLGASLKVLRQLSTPKQRHTHSYEGTKTHLHTHSPDSKQRLGSQSVLAPNSLCDHNLSTESSFDVEDNLDALNGTGARNVCRVLV